VNWYEVITSLGIFTVGSISITGLLAFFGRKLFEQYLQKKLDDHRNQLQLILQEHKIRYSKLHSDRADVIRVLYEKLVIMEQSMRTYVFPAQFRGDLSRKDKKTKAGNAADDFFYYFYPNEVLFDDSICNLVNEMNKLYQNVWVHTTMYDNEVAQADLETHYEFDDGAVEAVMKAWETIDAKIPPLKDNLKIQLRKLLGVTESKATEDVHSVL
jgi:hypothetical protein